MRSKRFLTWFVFGAAILIAATASHAPSRWFWAASGGVRATIDPGNHVEDGWIFATVEGPELEGSIFGWRRVGGGGTDEEVRRFAAEIDRLMPGSTTVRATSRLETPGTAVGSAPSTIRTTLIQTFVMSAAPLRAGASIAGAGVSTIVPEVGQAASRISTGLAERGFSSDPSLRFGSPYTGVGGALRRLVPPIGTGTGTGGGAGVPPAVGSSLPEPGIAGTIILVFAAATRRTRRVTILNPAA